MRKVLFTLLVAVCASNSFAYYQAQQGRWMSRDPIAEQGGVNVYAYGGNKPLNGYDSLGLDFIAVGRAAVGPLPFDHMSILYYKDSCTPPEGTKFSLSNTPPSATLEDQWELVPRHLSYFLPVASSQVIQGLPSELQSGASAVLPSTLYEPVSISFIRNTTGASDVEIIYADTANGTVSDAANQWRRIVAAAASYRFAEHGDPGSSLSNWPYSIYGWPSSGTPFLHQHALGRIPPNNSNTFVHEMARVIGRSANMFPRAVGNTSADASIPWRYFFVHPVYNPVLPQSWSPMF
jgi:hypothetical protein